MLNLWNKIEGDGNRIWMVNTPPATEPIFLSEVKTYSRIDGSAEDTILESFITAVREGTENYLGKALITQTLTMSMDWWPGIIINLPRPPLISVAEVRTVDEDDIATVYSANNYYTRGDAVHSQLVLKQGVSFPLNTSRDFGGYEIEWVAGYGAASSVPNAIKEAMKLWVAMIYEQRVPIEQPPDIAKTLMNSYRILPT